MSIASTAQRVSLLDVVRAEALRSRRTFTWGSVAAPLIMSVWAINLASALEAADLSTADGRWAGNILAWMSFYPNAVALPVGALVGAMHEWRERRVRGGGTLWRPTDPRRILTARCLIRPLDAGAHALDDGVADLVLGRVVVVDDRGDDVELARQAAHRPAADAGPPCQILGLVDDPFGSQPNPAGRRAPRCRHRGTIAVLTPLEQ